MAPSSTLAFARQHFGHTDLGDRRRTRALVDLVARYILRHTFCSRLAARNVPMLTIKELAGHQSLETTQRYMHLSQAAPREGIRALELGTSLAPSDAQQKKTNEDAD